MSYPAVVQPQVRGDETTRMPVLDGVEATRRIAADPEMTNVRVLVLTTYDDDELVFQALRAGAGGFLLKDAAPEDLVRGVRILASGEALLAPASHGAWWRHSPPGPSRPLPHRPW